MHDEQAREIGMLVRKHKSVDRNGKLVGLWFLGRSLAAGVRDIVPSTMVCEEGMTLGKKVVQPCLRKSYNRVLPTQSSEGTFLARNLSLMTHLLQVCEGETRRTVLMEVGR